MAAKVVSATINAGITSTVTQATTLASSAMFDSTGGKNNYTLGGSKSIVGTQQCSQRVTLIAGVATLDFTSMLGVDGAVISATGGTFKLYALAFRAQTDGAGAHVNCGASNGYPISGLTDWKLPLPAVTAGGMVVMDLGTGQTAVTAGTGSDGHKTIDFTGNTTQYIDVIAIFGV